MEQTGAGWIMKSTSDCSNYQRMHYPGKLNSQAPGLFVISVSQSVGSVVWCGVVWRCKNTLPSGFSLIFISDTATICLHFHQKMTRGDNGFKSGAELSRVFSKYRWCHSLQVNHRREETSAQMIKMTEPSGQLQHSAVEELNSWLTQAEQH